MVIVPASGRLRRQLVEARLRLGVPALGGAIVGHGGIVELDVVGTRKRGDSGPAAPDDQWHIGSCGKAITAALYARLVEQGLARWEAPIPTLFPDLRTGIVGDWSASTIDDIFRCRAGMRANLTRREIDDAWREASPLPAQRTRAVVTALRRPPHRRGRFRYSNLGYIVAGAAIERITDTTFEKAVTTHLLDPLGVTTAGFGPPADIWGHRPRVQLSGLCLGAGRPAAPDDPRSDNPAVMTPAGRLHLTLADWARVHLLFLGDGGDLLAPASIARLTELPAATGRTMAMGWAPARLGEATLGMQGSNTCWVATALVDTTRRRASLVVTNDGRTRILTRTAGLAAALLATH